MEGWGRPGSDGAPKSSVFRDMFRGAISFDFGWISEGSGRPKTRKKSIFEGRSGDLFCEGVFKRFFRRFSEGPNPENRAPAYTGARFRKIDVFEKSSKKLDWGLVFGKPNP